MNERQQRFIGLLNQIFELDKSDLDFGIYRILNIRRNEISKYFEERLPAKITEILSPFACADNSVLEVRIHAIETNLGGADQIALLPKEMPMVKDYYNLKNQLKQGSDLSALESDVYGALYSFFSRYYDEGDFISKRRYKEGVYAIPYEGEEVKLYWANQDQYYIKTSENFKDYTFLAGDYTINFHLVDATTEQNNNKEADDKKRQFMLFVEDEEKYPGVRTFEVDGKTVTIRFRFDVPEEPNIKYAEENLSAIKSWLANQKDFQLLNELMKSAGNNPKKPISLLEKHLQGYVAKNTFDYFIHKDLGGFLNRELEFFIKNEIMHLDDIDTDNVQRVETYLAKVRAVKNVGKEIISFLARIEDFQKKLWLKKKFVVDTQWCITLDKIDESFYDEIRTNRSQVEEWKQMYAIDELTPDLEHTEPFTEVPSVLFLKQNQNLIVDTRHFSNDFKLRLVESIDNVDEQTNGVMFNADNFQALGLMQERYNGNIGYCYIDPPYNTNSSRILYKNGYKDSSWNSLMYDRIALADTLLKDGSIITIAIDNEELYNLGQILDEIYGHDNRIAVVTVQHNPKGRNQALFFSENVEYMLEYSNDKSQAGFNDVAIDEVVKETFTEQTGSGKKYRWESFVRARLSRTKEKRPDNWYPLYVNQNLSFIDSKPFDNCLEVWPVVASGDFTWKNKRKTFDALNKNGYFKAERVDDRIEIFHQYLENQVLKNLWIDKKYQSEFNGTQLLKAMFGTSESPFSFPKSLYAVSDSIKLALQEGETVIDYFAGSGTTGHAVIHLNREDDFYRKYILVEMGIYFETVTLPRVKKAIYASDWKDGKPVSYCTGVSQIVKYMRLESYEDALSNIELKENTGMKNLFGEDYYINYMLDLETKDSLLNMGAFRTPFSYEMKITEKNESRYRPVDVVETFNYLIGLTVCNQGRVRSYNALPATQPEYDGAVDLKTATNGEYAFQQIEGTLRDGRRALIIWRTVGDDILAGNAALDAYFQKYRINPQDREYDVIYVNGDNNIENLRQDNEDWKVLRIEEVFNRKMFDC